LVFFAGAVSIFT